MSQRANRLFGDEREVQANDECQGRGVGENSICFEKVFRALLQARNFFFFLAEGASRTFTEPSGAKTATGGRTPDLDRGTRRRANVGGAAVVYLDSWTGWKSPWRALPFFDDGPLNFGQCCRRPRAWLVDRSRRGRDVVTARACDSARSSRQRFVRGVPPYATSGGKKRKLIKRETLKNNNNTSVVTRVILIARGRRTATGEGWSLGVFFWIFSASADNGGIFYFSLALLSLCNPVVFALSHSVSGVPRRYRNVEKSALVPRSSCQQQLLFTWWRVCVCVCEWRRWRGTD